MISQSIILLIRNFIKNKKVYMKIFQYFLLVFIISLTACVNPFINTQERTEYYPDIEYVKELGGLGNPQGIGIDNYGYIYVCDNGNNSIVKYNSNLDFISQFTVTSPVDIKFDDSGDIYVLNRAGNLVIKYNKSFALIRQILTPGLPNKISISSKNDIFVTEDNQVLKYSSNLNYIKSYTGTMFKGIFIDKTDLIYVCCNDGDLYVLDDDLNLINRTKIVDFAGIQSIYFDSLNYMYVTAKSTELYIYSPKGILKKSLNFGSTLNQITINLTGEIYITRSTPSIIYKYRIKNWPSVSFIDN